MSPFLCAVMPTKGQIARPDVQVRNGNKWQAASSIVANLPKECRRQALACVQLALESALPKDREGFARLAMTLISLASDLEAIEAQLKSKREGTPFRRTGT